MNPNTLNVKWRLRPTRDGGWEGEITIPFVPGIMPGVKAVKVVGAAPEKAQALGKAAVAAKKIEEQLAAHPALAAILPPGAPLALHAIGTIARSATAGRLAEAMAHHTGPAMHRLGKALGL